MCYDAAFSLCWPFFSPFAAFLFQSIFKVSFRFLKSTPREREPNSTTENRLSASTFAHSPVRVHPQRVTLRSFSVFFSFGLPFVLEHFAESLTVSFFYPASPLNMLNICCKWCVRGAQEERMIRWCLNSMKLPGNSDGC